MVGEICETPSHWRQTKTLSEWMKEQNIPGIYEIDTRALTKIIREKGSILGRIVFDQPIINSIPLDPPITDPNKRNLVAEVSQVPDDQIYLDRLVNCLSSCNSDLFYFQFQSVQRTYNPSGYPRICVIDCGLKYNQLRCLISRGARVDVVPWDCDVSKIEYDGLFLSNGPGDPSKCNATVENIRTVLEQRPQIPIFGICLGHQLLCIAAGCLTYKMR